MKKHELIRLVEMIDQHPNVFTKSNVLVALERHIERLYEANEMNREHLNDAMRSLNKLWDVIE